MILDNSFRKVPNLLPFGYLQIKINLFSKNSTLKMHVILGFSEKKFLPMLWDGKNVIFYEKEFFEVNFVGLLTLSRIMYLSQNWIILTIKELNHVGNFFENTTGHFTYKKLWPLASVSFRQLIVQFENLKKLVSLLFKSSPLVKEYQCKTKCLWRSRISLTSFFKQNHMTMFKVIATFLLFC